MNVYDFDGTIYNGESTFDFYCFSVRKQPKLIKYFFVVAKTLILYKLCLVSEAELLRLAQTYIKRYLADMKDMDQKVVAFWDQYQHKIKPFYHSAQKADDVIVSASADFLLTEIFQRIGIKQYLCTRLDTENGEVLSLCYRKTKAVLFQAAYPDAVVDNFYTDSLNDEAMMQLAKQTYLVKGNRITFLTSGKNRSQ